MDIANWHQITSVSRRFSLPVCFTTTWICGFATPPVNRCSWWC